MRPPQLVRSVVFSSLLCGCRLAGAPAPTSDVWDPQSGQASGSVVEHAKPRAGAAAGVMDLLAQELTLNLERLTGDGVEDPAYFLAYDLVASRGLWLEAQEGEITRRDLDDERVIDVDVRVGTRALDNGHASGGEHGPGNGLGSRLHVSKSDVPLSLAQSLWLETEAQYRDAVTAFNAIESDEQLRSESGRREHPDFSEEKPLVDIQVLPELDLEQLEREWTKTVLTLSTVLASSPHVLESRVVLAAEQVHHHMVNSEATRIQGGRTHLRLIFEAYGQAEDGMRLQRSESFEVHVSAQMPELAVLEATAARLRDELVALREAPLAEPFTGPAILEGRAAGVFFHEIFGHRLEGHRQKDDFEGQTFADMVDRKVLPWFLDVVDDPTIRKLGGVPLSGHYLVDDEGVAARRVKLVDRGKLKTFLLGRSPVLPFRHSNGHGRREAGHQALARQGNLVVSSRKALTRLQLRAELLDEVRKQGKPYGLWFTDIEGGYTITDRSGPQAFKVLPLMVYRVFPDGRQDQLVRGADIVGTPLAAFETILATDDKLGIFNGMCYAESGWVPVSAVSPSLLLRNIEIERAAHERDRPPLLPPPRPRSGGAAR